MKDVLKGTDKIKIYSDCHKQAYVGKHDHSYRPEQLSTLPGPCVESYR